MRDTYGGRVAGQTASGSSFLLEFHRGEINRDDLADVIAILSAQMEILPTTPTQDGEG